MEGTPRTEAEAPRIPPCPLQAILTLAAGRHLVAPHQAEGPGQTTLVVAAPEEDLTREDLGFPLVGGKGPRGAEEREVGSRIMCLRVLIAGAGIVAIVVVVLFVVWQWSWGPRPFDSAVWIEEGRIPKGLRHEDNTHRHRMILDLMDGHGLVGMDIENVLGLLGEPDSRAAVQNDIVYYIRGPSITDFDLAEFTLLVRNNVVVGAVYYGGKWGSCR